MDEPIIEIVQKDDYLKEVNKARNIDISDYVKPKGRAYLINILTGIWMRSCIGFRALLLIAIGIAMCFTGAGIIYIILNSLRLIDMMSKYKGQHVTAGTFFSSLLIALTEIALISSVANAIMDNPRFMQSEYQSYTEQREMIEHIPTNDEKYIENDIEAFIFSDIKTYSQIKSTYYTVVEGTELNLREGPSINNGIIRVIYRGELLELLNEEVITQSGSMWYKVYDVQTDQTGWVNNKYIEPVSISDINSGSDDEYIGDTYNNNEVLIHKENTIKDIAAVTESYLNGLAYAVTNKDFTHISDYLFPESPHYIEQQKYISNVEAYEQFISYEIKDIQFLDLNTCIIKIHEVFLIQNYSSETPLQEVKFVNTYTLRNSEGIWLFYSLDELTEIESTIVNSNTATSKELTPTNPVAYSGFILGGSINGKWVSAEDIAEFVIEGQPYKLYSFNGFEGTGTGGKVFALEDWGNHYIDTTYHIYEQGSNLERKFIAVSGEWDGMPRIPQEQTAAIYDDIVNDILEGYGLRNPVVNIIQNYRIDLNGDGREEVVLYAEYSADNRFSATAGDYSLLVLRKIVDETVSNIVLSSDIHLVSNISGEWSNPLRVFYEICGFVDLDGDGTMEIIASESYYEGIFYFVFELTHDGAIKIDKLGNGGGA